LEIIVENEINSTQTLKLIGEIDLSGTQKLNSAFDDALSSTAKTIFLDLQLLNYIDSTGLGIFIRLKNALDNEERSLILVSPTPQALRLLDLTETRALFEIQENPNIPLNQTSI
jgi:anti-sigma B factor antagonist